MISVVLRAMRSSVVSRSQAELRARAISRRAARDRGRDGDGSGGWVVTNGHYTAERAGGRNHRLMIAEEDADGRRKNHHRYFALLCIMPRLNSTVLSGGS